MFTWKFRKSEYIYNVIKLASCLAINALFLLLFFIFKEERMERGRERGSEGGREKEKKDRERERGRENRSLALLPRLEYNLKIGIKNLFYANNCA